MSQQYWGSSQNIVAAIGHPETLHPLLAVGWSLARANKGRLTMLTVSQLNEPPEWCKIPENYQDALIATELIQSDNAVQSIVKYVRKTKPDLLILGWRHRPAQSGYVLSRTLDNLLQTIRCPVVVVKAPPDWPDKDFREKENLPILVPAAGGPNAPLAIDLALNFAPNSQVSALYVLREAYADDEARTKERTRWLTNFTQQWQENDNFKLQFTTAETILDGLVNEARNHDITMIGASDRTIFNQLLFGAIPEQLAEQNSGATLIVRRREDELGSMVRQTWWRLTHILPKLSMEERMEVYKQVRRGARPQTDFFVMIGLAAGIAAFGLLLNSASIIIGAMLVAPLMAAIMGIGLGMIQADTRLLQLSLSATLRGVLLAIGIGVLAGAVDPNGQFGAEIINRTAPSLLDLAVALVSGLAGAYAICRTNVSNSLPGVAIAAALVPPLTVVGLGLSVWNHEIAGGALLLFLTNLIAISTASGFIFFLFGFRPRVERQGHFDLFRTSVLTSGILLTLMAITLWWLTTLAATEVVDTSPTAVLITPDHDGRNFFWTPDGRTAGFFAEEISLELMGERQTVDEVEWVQVKAEDGRFGWIEAEFLQPVE